MQRHFGKINTDQVDNNERICLCRNNASLWGHCVNRFVLNNVDKSHRQKQNSQNKNEECDYVDYVVTMRKKEVPRKYD